MVLSGMKSCISLKSKIAWNHCYCKKNQHLCINYASQPALYDIDDDPAINSYFPGSLKTCFFLFEFVFGDSWCLKSSFGKRRQTGKISLLARFIYDLL